MIELESREGLCVAVELAKQRVSQGRPCLVLVAGKYDTDKKSVLNRFLKRFPGQVAIIHHNDYLQKTLGKRVTEDPTSIGWSALRQDVQKLLAGQKILKPRYNAAKHILEGEEQLAGQVVIVWGVFALQDQALVKRANLRLFCESDKLTRLIRYFVSELKAMKPSEIIRSLLDGQKTNKRIIEPTRSEADFVLRNNSQPTFSGLKAKKLIDHARWPLKLSAEEMAVCGRIKSGPTRHQVEHYLFSRDKKKIVRLRADSIAFKSLDETSGPESWYEFKIALGLGEELAELYRQERITVHKLRTIYEIVGSRFRFYVDRRVQVSSLKRQQEVGDFSGLIRRRGARSSNQDFDQILSTLKLQAASLAPPYYLLV